MNNLSADIAEVLATSQSYMRKTDVRDSFLTHTLLLNLICRASVALSAFVMLKEQ